MVRSRALQPLWRWMSLALVASLAASMTLVASSDRDAEAGSYSFTSSERCLMKKVNDFRARHGRRRLSWDKQVGYVARRHARSMASRRTIWHSQEMGRQVTRWRRLGQNVGKGGGCHRLFRAFKRSSKHRSNMLGTWRHMGVGTEWSGGAVYVHQIFESRRDPGNIWGYP